MTRDPLRSGPPVPAPEAPPRGGPSRGQRGLPRAARVAVQLALTVGVTALIVDRIGVTLEDVLALDRALPAPSVVALSSSLVLLVAGFLLAARLWGWMVRELGGPDPGAWASARIVLTANLGRYLPGKIWQIAGLALLSRRAAIPATTGTTAGLLVQGFTLAAAAAWGVPVLLQPGQNGAGRVGVWVVAILAGLVVLSSVPAVTRGAIRVLFRVARQDPDAAPCPGPGFGPRWTAWHLVVWGIYGAAFMAFVRALGFDASWEVVPAFAGAYLLGYLAVFAPAGLGVREGFLIAFLQPVLGGAAVGVAVLARLWMTVGELVPAGILAGWELLRPTGEARAVDVGGEGKSDV